MADNYLERRMEDLRAGRIGASASVSTVGARRKGYIQVPFPPRRVIVTGGANGIGLAISRAFLKAGCKVAVMDCDEEAGNLIAAGEGVRFYNVDLADSGAVRQAFDDVVHAWRDIDIIVSNAGVGHFRPLTEGDDDYFRHVLDINLLPAYTLARLWARFRQDSPLTNPFGGRFIIISSTRHIQSEAGTEAYSASKGALASLTHSLMMSLSPYGITSNCISPGWINVKDETLSEADSLQHPSRRVGVPDDIARVCLFLSAPGNDFINGADIPVDGGMTRRMIYEP